MTTHWIRAGAGFQDQVDVELVKEANIGEEKNKYLVLLWDEMKIKEDLVFDKNTCQLIGFTDLGDINNHLDNFERHCSSNNTSSDVATHMLMFMVRGLCSHLEYPYAQFPTRGATADSLFSIVWESVQRLESSGFKVIAFTCDGASSNRKFFKMHQRGKKLTYKTENPYSDNNREIYIFCDVPHLMKTTRNCWSNSFGHKHSRALWVS